MWNKIASVQEEHTDTYSHTPSTGTAPPSPEETQEKILAQGTESRMA